MRLAKLVKTTLDEARMLVLVAQSCGDSSLAASFGTALRICLSTPYSDGAALM
jgi:hypothetical protein